MHKIRKVNRVKTGNLVYKYVLGWMSAQGRTAQKKRTKKYEQQKVTCSKLSAVVATADFQQKKRKEKDLWILRQNLKREALAKL
jgi:ribosomal protein L20